MREDFKPIAGSEGSVAESGAELHSPSDRSGHPVTLPKSGESERPGHPPAQLAGHFSGRTETTHTYDYSRRAYTTGGKLACGRRGSDVADYRIVDAHYPDDAANMVITDGLGAAVAVAKRASIPNARTYVEDAFRRWTERGAVSAGMKIIEAQGFDPTPADNAEVDWCPVFVAEAKFVMRRIVQLRRDGRTREARALRELLPERFEWREWTGTLTERDRRRIAEEQRRIADMEAAQAAFNAAVASGELPDPETTDLTDMIIACFEADRRRAGEQGAEGADM